MYCLGESLRGCKIYKVIYAKSNLPLSGAYVGRGAEVYTGAAYEGVALLPQIGEKLMFVLNPLFGFTDSQAIAFPITSLGAVGAAMSLVPRFIQEQVITPNDIAVFTAMGMCWSGYLSTHVGMMDALGVRRLSSKAILSHTVGGICAGIAAHFIYLFIA